MAVRVACDRGVRQCRRDDTFAMSPGYSRSSFHGSDVGGPCATRSGPRKIPLMSEGSFAVTERLRIGAVSYLNSKPLIHDLAELAPDADLVLDYPSRLA